MILIHLMHLPKLYKFTLFCSIVLAVVADDEICDPLDFDEPPGSRTPPTLQVLAHSLNKEESQLLCDAMRRRVEDEDAALTPRAISSLLEQWS
jgi:hypothetical protein